MSRGLLRPLWTVTVLALATSCSNEPEEKPETVVQAAVEARASGHCDVYTSHFVDDPVGGCGEPAPVVGNGPQVGAADVHNDTAEVEVTDYYDCSAWDAPPVEYLDVYRLVVEDGEWLIEDIEFAETTSDDCFS